MKLSMSYCVRLLAGCAMLAGIEACEKDSASEQKTPPPVPVAVYTVKAQQASYFEEYPATVVTLNQVELRPEVSGNIVKIGFTDGQHVRKGAMLYVIDQQQYKAAYEQAVATLNVARANLSRAQKDAERYRDLGRQDAIARQSLEHAETDLEAASMQVSAAEANVNAVETNLKRSVISAPFDGTIGISLVRTGSAVTAGATLLNTISTDSPMGVDFSIDEKQLSRFTRLVGEAPPVTDSTFTILLPDQTVYPYHGHVKLLDRAVDPQTGTIRVRVEFPNPKRELRPGMTCDLRVKTDSPVQSVLIPYRAVTEQMGEYFVFVVQGNKVRQKRVTLGQTLGEKVIVRDGLKTGETIVTEGMQRLRDNASVSVGGNAGAGTTGSQPSPQSKQ
ncbi:MAG TPA: efflux RND transporter periplasmic adaptor subunit [Bacteroidota bacterium]|nr:efflux RND transporter periplasmic adaptor subunit [Bacteroidota bacterium]